MYKIFKNYQNNIVVCLVLSRTYKCVSYFPVLMKVSLFAEASDLGRLAEFVNRINIKISPLHLQIKKGINEVTAAQYYGLVGYCKV